MRRRDASGNEIDLVPLDLSERLHKVFQTRSSEEFNCLFKHSVQTSTFLHSRWGSRRGPSQIRFLSWQKNIYIELCADGKWIGTTQNKATFPNITSPKAASAFLGKVNCHRGPHFLRDCQQPLGQARIEANRQRVVEARKIVKEAGSTKQKDQKWNHKLVIHRVESFRQKTGRNQPNRCEVDGKHCYYHYKSNKWLPVDRQANHSETPRTTSTASSTALLNHLEANLHVQLTCQSTTLYSPT
jgi:hypothetical protein